jgi:hypothetical protein
VRYGYRQNNSSTPPRRNVADRRRSYYTDNRGVQQAHELNPQVPEFQSRNMEERQRSEEAGVHTARSMANHLNQEN